jgi:hypothetical protein
VPVLVKVVIVLVRVINLAGGHGRMTFGRDVGGSVCLWIVVQDFESASFRASGRLRF